MHGQWEYQCIVHVTIHFSHMIKTEYSSLGDDLLINSNVVSEITERDDNDVSPPNKTMTLKFGPIPNMTAE